MAKKESTTKEETPSITIKPRMKSIRTKKEKTFLATFPELAELCKKYKVERIELKIQDKGKSISHILNPANENLSD